MFDAKWFFDLDSRLRAAGLDSDAQSFDQIKDNLMHRHICDADAFASQCAYVILAGGFSQKTAKSIHEKIMSALRARGADFDYLFSIFHNKNKINAICKIWENRNALCAEYYKLNDVDARLGFLSRLPHIGKITANHLARNLGEDVVKYDIWIQRLGAMYSGDSMLYKKIDNKKLNPDIRAACDAMFEKLCAETSLPRGYIDVVLWKALQTGLIKL